MLRRGLQLGAGEIGKEVSISEGAHSPEGAGEGGSELSIESVRYFMG